VKRAWIAAAAVAVVAVGLVGALLMMHGRRVIMRASDGGVTAALGRWGVEGRVVDRLGRPIAGARVVARAAGDGGTEVIAHSDGEGRYGLKLGSGAAARLRVEADGFVTEEVPGVIPPQAGLEIALSRRLALEGIVRAHGQPAGGAEVTIAGASGTRAAKSGPDGAFSFGALAEGRYALRAVRGEAEAAYLDGVMVTTGDGGAGVVVVELQPATTLAGKLRERGGRPIGGGEVTLSEADGAPLPRSVVTDNEGNFHFVAVLPGSYVVSAHAEGFYPAEPKSLRVGKTAPTVELRLDPGATVEGRVVDEHAQPVAGADVEVSGETPDGTPIAMTATSSTAAAATGARVEPAGELGILRGPVPYPPPVPMNEPAPAPKQFRTDDKGAFRVTGLPAGKLVVVATHPEFARGSSEPMHVVAGADLKVTVVLSRGVELHGRVVDDRGDPVGGAELVGEGAALATTDARGEWSIAHVARAMTLTVRATGYLPATRAVSPSERGPFDVTLRKAEGRLAGDVVDDRGTPVSAARVQIDAPPMPKRWATTDRSGHFSADGLGPGPYRVVVTHADFAPATFEAVAPTDDARLALAPGGGIDGDVRDARLGGVPPAVRLELRVAGSVRLLPVERDGRFSATAVPAGRATLAASAPGYVTLAREIDVIAGDRPHDVTVRDVRIELERGGTIVGRVRDDHGDPVADAAVTAGGLRARSDRDGNFRLDSVAAGRVRVLVEKGGVSAGDDVEVRASDESRVELRLR
jgi:protocatechuate 3,4-dioxygenase beta subunit